MEYEQRSKKKILNSIFSTSVVKTSFWLKKHFQNLYIDCVFYDVSVQLLYLLSSQLFFKSFM